MASLRRFPSSPYWYACFTDSKGKRTQISTRETRRSVAQRIADAWQRAAKRELTLERANWIMTELTEGIIGRRESPSIYEFCKEWLVQRKGEIAVSTMTVYTQAVERLCSLIGDEKLANLSEPALVRARNSNLKALSVSTVNLDVRIWRMILGHAVQRRWIERNPAKGLRPIKDSGEERRRPFTVEEIRKVLAVADREWRLMILFGLYTGLRLGDIAALRRDDIDLGAGCVRTQTRKTGRRVEIPLAPPLVDELGGGVPDPVHPRAYDTMRRQGGRVGILSSQFGDLLAHAGLRQYARHVRPGELRDDPTTLSFHCLRHTCNTWLEEAGVPRAVVMEIIGHEDPGSGRRYTHVGRTATQKAVEILPII